ncbi:hydroxyacid dehydrogenase [Marinobacter zhanjiangensis]|uniref:Lactate dehydrogenase n=1 Tax=Marinobacter zhanjiangensis TaxID=578215 RepID=A0ABQ3B3P0_9GAMM|nr:hydroxyacid dehydrogenase [Marinobacter zhanjiangensis]GGY76865.1 lactate dehydrogenase [Marinobacter zhanjiangensis]
MNIVFFDVEKWERDSFEALREKHTVSCAEEPLKAGNAGEYAAAEAISVFIYSKVDRQALDAMPDLKLITSRSTGFDHIDIGECERRGITVCNCPDYGEHTVAEHVFGLLLMISHRLEEAVERTRKGGFSPRGLQGFDLRGKTLGVVGTGDIGLATIRIARGFGMDVLAFDIKPDETAAQDLEFEYVDMDQLLQDADVITLHVPANPQTHHLIDADAFAKMKDGVVLINTARGDVVDIRALARALAEQKVAAAGLDVLPYEPVVREEAELLRSVYEETEDLSSLLANEVLVRMKNVVVTPHSAFNTREAVQRILDGTVENIRRFVEGNPVNVVTDTQ